MRFYLTSHSVSSSSFELANAFRSILPPVSRLATHNCGGGRISRETSPRLAEAHSLTSAPNREWAPLSQTLLNAPRFFFCLFRNIWAACHRRCCFQEETALFQRFFARSGGGFPFSKVVNWICNSRNDSPLLRCAAAAEDGALLTCTRKLLFGSVSVQKLQKAQPFIRLSSHIRIQFPQEDKTIKVNEESERLHFEECCCIESSNQNCAERNK